METEQQEHQEQQGPAVDPLLLEFFEAADETGQAEAEAAKPSRVAMLTPFMGKAWGGGCYLTSVVTEVEQIRSRPAEDQLAGECLATIFDVVAPAGWLTELDPNSPAGRLVLAGATLGAMIREKHKIIAAEYERREEAAEKEAAANGNKS